MQVNWNEIKHFKKSEWVHDPDLVPPTLAYGLDMARDTTICDRFSSGVPIYIHECWAKDGHSPQSYHYTAQAVDFHFACDTITFFEQFVILLSVPQFMAFGFYPQWEPCPGWHVDIRRGKSRIYWTKVGGQYRYGWEAVIDQLFVPHNRRSGI